MTEQRAPYRAGRPPAAYQITCSYLIWRGDLEPGEAKLRVEAKDALGAAEAALAMVKAAAGPYPVTNLVLQVSLDL